MKLKGFLFYVLLVTACKSIAPKVVSPEAQMSSSSCKVEATIIRILPPSSPDSMDVCYQHACDAVARIDRIIRCGKNGSVVPDEKGEINLHFIYTLNPTEKLFPDMKPVYPGLTTGSKFSASIENRPALGDKVTYLVYGYSAE